MTRLKALICVVMLAGAISAAIGAAPAPAATECTPPVVNGIKIFYLHEQEIGCHHAREQAVHIIHTGTPSGWSCKYTITGRYTHTACHKLEFPSHTLAMYHHAA